MDRAKVSQVTGEKLRDQLNALVTLLHDVVQTPSLSQDPKFLQQAQEIICSLNELSKL